MAIKSIEPAQRVPPKEKMTFEEFLAWCDEDTWAEWVDGEVIMVSPASERHQEIGSFLETILRIYTKTKKLGRILRAPFPLRLPELEHAREPDLLFVPQDRVNLIQKTYLNGAPDLIVEIVSPESIGRDRGEKFVEYEKADVKEYWLIDPDRERAEFCELANDGRYRVAEIDSDGIYRSKVIQGFWLRAEWLWQTPLPAELDVLRELKVL